MEEANANGRVLPASWKTTVAVIWAGQAASILATYAATFAALWYITESTGSSLVLSLAGIAALLPTALLSPFGGVVADRTNRKMVMVLADGLAGAFSLVLALVVFGGQASVVLLLALLAVRSAAQAFHSTSMMALMPDLVPERHLVRLNTLDQTLASASGIVGPVLGIALYTAFGFASVLLLDAACALVACVCLLAVKLPYAHGAGNTTGSVLGDMREGIAVIRSDRGIVVLLVLVMLAMLVFMPMGTLSPMLTYGWFGGDGFQASIVEAAAAIGMLAGSVVVMVWGGGRKLTRVMAVSGLIMGAGCVAAGVLPCDGFWAFVMLAGVIFAAMAAFNAPIIPLLQKRIPQEKFGRVMGLFLTGTSIAAPIGLLVAGPAAETLGVNTWFVVCGALLCLLMAVAFFSKRVRTLDNAEATANTNANANTNAADICSNFDE